MKSLSMKKLLFPLLLLMMIVAVFTQPICRFVIRSVFAFGADKPSGCGSLDQKIAVMIAENAEKGIIGCESLGTTVGTVYANLNKVRPRGGTVDVKCKAGRCTIAWKAYSRNYRSNNLALEISFDDDEKIQRHFTCHQY